MMDDAPSDPFERPARDGATPVRPRERFLVFGQPTLGEEEAEAVAQVVRGKWIGLGPRVHAFEQAFAERSGYRHAIAVNSCSAALHLSTLALGLGPGDEVITTAMTFCASVNAIIHSGATPVLADCDPRTMNIDPAAIEARITDRTRALLIVHFAGRPCEMAAICAIAERHGLRIIEDCAHAIEATVGETPVGRIGDIGCFSFYATKNLTTGEGGMIVTDDDAIAERLRLISLHGLSRDAWRRFADAGYLHYDVAAAGFKYNMTDLAAAIGLVQLDKLDAGAVRRRTIWAQYDAAFADLPCDLPVPPAPDTIHARHLYTPLLRTDEIGISRDGVLDAMTAEGIGVGVHYLAIPALSFYRDRYGWDRTTAPVAWDIGERTISLPLMAGLDEDDVADVIRAFRRVLRACMR